MTQKTILLGDETLLSPQEVAELSGYGRPYIYKAIERGLLAAEKINGRWLVRLRDVEVFVNRPRTRLPHWFWKKKKV